ncbi:hypothetical protein DSO57_1036888 [Entomophthora muscae]|uniref:Uncharacterized protein n=1 Tax=Entomophthora muscae TaxID=34485 RepID=A0ACC2SNU1_9FUNG|nr:hypothetical protein DSO57_1036888 [Entomophthora muscae]
MADKDDGFISMAEIRERHRAKRAKRQLEAPPTLSKSFLESFNLTTSFHPKTPVRTRSFIPSKSAILKGLQRYHNNPNISFSNQRPDQSTSFMGNTVGNTSFMASRSMLGRDAFGQQQNILDGSVLSAGIPDLSIKADRDPFKRARTDRQPTPTIPQQPCHLLYRPVSVNPFDIFNKISLGEDRVYFENPHLIPSFGCEKPDPAMLTTLRRELSALKAVDRPDCSSDLSDSDSDSPPSPCMDSDDDFHVVPITKRGEEPRRTRKEQTPEPEKSLEEKVSDFLHSYRPAPSFNGEKFSLSKQIPLELSIKESCTFISQSSLSFFAPPAQAELQAYCQYSSACHSFSSWKTFDLSSASLYQVLTTHHYPAAPRPKYLAAKTNEILSISQARDSKLSPEQIAMLAEFTETESEWQDSFVSLFTACMANLVPYFYYISTELTIMIVSPTASQDIITAHQTHGICADPSPVAYLYGATPGLINLFNSRGIAFSMSALTPSDRRRAPPKSVSKEDLKKFLRAAKPPKGSQLLFEGQNRVEHLFRFLRDWRNPKQEFRCLGPPTLIAPTPFKRSQSRIPKITHRETKATDPHFIEPNAKDSPTFELKIDGLILPSALKVVVQMLLAQQIKAFNEDPSAFQFSEIDPKNDDGSPRNEFRFKVFLKPHIDTVGLFGRWALPSSSLPYSEPPELFDQGIALPLPGPNDFIIPSTHLFNFLYFSTRFFW